MKLTGFGYAAFGLICLTSGMFCPLLAESNEAIDQARAEDPRVQAPLVEGWQFNLVGDDKDASNLPREDGWQSVNVPHTWNRVGYYLSDPETHINSAENVDKTQGVGWYYLSFTAPPRDDGREAFLEFDAASRTAEVWLNGQYLGEHRNPFSRFRLDATDAIRFGEVNSLYVKVDNTQPTKGSSTADVLPMTGDFFVRGGLYRPVNLILTEPVHFDLLDFGGPGVYATTKSIAKNAAEIALVARIKNDSLQVQEVSVTAQLLDNKGRAVASWSGETNLAGNTTAELPGALHVVAPHLWNGVVDPYLYALRFEIRSASGKLLDTVDQSFGIREMHIDPVRGFMLNGKVYPLRGAGFHQDNEKHDWAQSPEDIEESIRIIRDIGANSIRLTHYQHGQTVYDLADRYGLVLWNEIALVTSWTNSKEQTEVPPGILANARLQLQELIRQNSNHPSVAVWGIANEVDFGAGRPDFLGRPPEKVASPMSLLGELDELAQKEDPSRPVVLAQCCEDRGMSDVPVVAEAVDAEGVNRYFGWYYGSPEQLGPHLDGLRRKRPNQPLSVSEYGAGGADNIHSDDPLGGPINMAGRTQPEEYQTWLHEQSWRELEPRSYLWGVWLWNSFDFGTTVRTEGDAQDINTKGLVTYDRKIRKDAFYFYRANWSDAPTVHINGRRYTNRAYPVTDVRVYSNALVTSLTLNGRVLGTLRDCPERICVWPDVRLKEGANSVVARGDFASNSVEDRVEWRLDAPQAHSFRIDSGAVVAAEADLQFGSDDFFVGGSAGSTDQPGGRGRQPVIAQIGGTERRDVVASFRQGDFHYRIPVEDGRYRVTLTFVEPDKAIGERVFNVSANGKSMLTDFDIHARAGALLTATVATFEVPATGGLLDLHFGPKTGEAIVSSLEIAPVK